MAILAILSHDFSGLLPIQRADIRLDDGVYDQWWIVLKNIVPASIGDNRFSVGLSIRKLAVAILPSGYISLIRKGRILRHQIDHWNFWRKSRTPHDFNGFRQIRRLVVTAQLFGCWLFFALPFFYEMFTYNPSNFVANGKYHRIKIELPNHGGYLVRARRGYYARNNASSSAPNPPAIPLGIFAFRNGP